MLQEPGGSTPLARAPACRFPRLARSCPLPSAGSPPAPWDQHVHATAKTRTGPCQMRLDAQKLTFPPGSGNPAGARDKTSAGVASTHDTPYTKRFFTGAALNDSLCLDHVQSVFIFNQLSFCSTHISVRKDCLKVFCTTKI